MDQSGIPLTRPGAMTSIYHMVISQPWLVLQVTGSITHARFWTATVFMYHYSDYCYAHIMRGNSA